MSVYEKFTFDGNTLDRMTIAALLAVNKDLGYYQQVVQGSYNAGGVGASGGTHDGGGAVDIVWVDMKRKNRAFRNNGWAFWPRPTLPGVWSRHGHGILIGNDRASTAAKGQVLQYREGRNGLADNGRDAFPYRPKHITAFSYSRCALVSWKRLNDIAKLPKGIPLNPGGARQVEVVAWALQGFNMSLDGHRRGRMDEPLIDALGRFAKLRHVGKTEVQGPVSPQVCYELCVPTRES